MPNEILTMIVGLAGSATLRAIRLTNKQLCAVANEPFATLHFLERKHVATHYSLDALVEITAHPFFGRYVKAVIISSYLQRDSLTPRNVMFRKKITQAFGNIKQNFGQVSVGVCNDPRGCFGSAKYLCRDGRLQRASQRFAMTKIFERMTVAARKAECEIGGVKIQVSGAALTRDEMRRYGAEIRDMLSKLQGADSPPTSLDFEYLDASRRAFSMEDRITYNHQTGRLNMSNLILGARVSDWSLYSYLENTLDWLSTRRITHLDISNCAFGSTYTEQLLLIPTIKNLRLRKITLETELFDRNLWSSFLHSIALLPELESFKLEQPQYGLGPYAGLQLALPSGDYPVNDQIHWDSCFNLVFADDDDGVICSNEEVDIHAQVEALANEVEQYELAKIAEIERDGFVRTAIVGIYEEPESDEDGEENEDEDEDAEDSEGDGDGSEESGNSKDIH